MKKRFLILMTVLLASLAALADVAINSTNFPDANFRNFLKSKYMLSVITTAQLNACTELDLNSLNIADLTGIEYFTQLTNLNCFNNKITSVDLSANTKLQELYLGNNKLTSIDLSANTQLQVLHLHNNQLNSSLNVATHSQLRTLWVHNNSSLIAVNCSNCNLTDFNVSNCTSMTTLECYGNTSLSTITGLSSCTNLMYMDCFNCNFSNLSALSELPNLAEIYCGHNKLDSLELSQRIFLETLDVSDNTQLTYLLCSRNRLQSLNVTGCTALEDLRCFYNYQLQSITGLADCAALKYLDCEGCRISDLSALNGLDNLEQIYCGSNQLTSLEISEKYFLRTLDVSRNKQLTYLLCSRSGLESLNVKGCTALEDLRCFYNVLDSITGLADCTAMTYLDCENGRICDLSAVSGMPNLETLLCGHNHLASLDVSGKHQLSEFSVSHNRLLTTLYCDSCNLTSLNLAACDSLEDLSCSNNHISSLNVTECPKLYILMCNNNELAQLDLSNNPELLVLWCRNNELTELDLSNCPDELYSLDCTKNNLTSLEVGRFTQLFQLYCFFNQISSLDVANHTVLRDLVCYDNQLSSLDVSGCSALETLKAQYCQLTSLNVADCPSLREIDIYYNRLKGQPVGQFVNGLSQRPADKKGVIYAVAFDYDYGAEGNHMTSVQVDQAMDKNWELFAYHLDLGWIPYSGEMTMGDINGDGVVTIADVTALIDALLSGESPVAGDVNSDTFVTIADVTALIDGLLSGTYNLSAHAGSTKGSIAIDEKAPLTIDREELQARHTRLHTR